MQFACSGLGSREHIDNRSVTYGALALLFFVGQNPRQLPWEMRSMRPRLVFTVIFFAILATMVIVLPIALGGSEDQKPLRYVVSDSWPDWCFDTYGDYLLPLREPIRVVDRDNNQVSIHLLNVSVCVDSKTQLETAFRDAAFGIGKDALNKSVDESKAKNQPVTSGQVKSVFYYAIDYYVKSSDRYRGKVFFLVDTQPTTKTKKVR